LQLLAGQPAEAGREEFGLLQAGLAISGTKQRQTEKL
jgi:hypothetical protein